MSKGMNELLEEGREVVRRKDTPIKEHIQCELMIGVYGEELDSTAREEQSYTHLETKEQMLLK